ncbi:MAG: tetratricopeptide repeat protein [Bacteroidota bacterium]
MAQQQFFDQVEAYLDGELDAEARTRFEAALQQDSELAAEVALAEDTRRLLVFATQQEYKEKLRAIDADMEAKTTPVVRPLWQRSWAQAAAAAVLLLIISSVLLFRGGPSSQALAQDSFTPYMDMISYKGSPAIDEDSLLLQAMYAYNTQDYKTALQGFEQILQTNPTQVSARFYQAQSYLALNQPLPALAVLQKLPQDGPLAEATQWYMALAYLMQDDQANAKQLFAEMAQDPNHGFQLKAEALLEKMK